jgi:hypothetical protein
MLFKSKEDSRDHHEQQDNGYHPWKKMNWWCTYIRELPGLHVASVEMMPYDLDEIATFERNNDVYHIGRNIYFVLWCDAGLKATAETTQIF